MPKISTPRYGELTESEFDLEQPTSTHLRRRATVIAAAAVIAAGAVHGGMTVYHHLRPAVTEQVTSSETGAPISIPQSVAASCGPGSTSPSQAFNESDTGAWVCRQSGAGTVLSIVLNPGDSISSVSIVPGLQYASGNGKIDGLQYRVPSEVWWKVEGRTDLGSARWQRKQDNLVSNIWNTLQLSAPMTNVKISLTVLETKSPAGFNLPADAPFAVQQIYLWR